MNITACRELICTGCGCCSSICLTGAISMHQDVFGFPRPLVDKNSCIDCGLCIKYCPQLYVPSKAKTGFQRIDYYGWSQNEKNHFAGTSGGIFPEMASHHLATDGIVFGAIWSNDFEDVYICSSVKDDLSKMLKSKYVFSDAIASYKNVVSYLLEGRRVLYCGAPCQIGALLRIIDKEGVPTDNLITCDFACGGFPSKKFWHEHLRTLKEKYGIIDSIDFRSKRKGWKHAFLEIKFRNGRQLFKRSFMDSYYNCYSDMHISVQQSCNVCKYRKRHLSDITIADFWEYKKAGISLNNKGLSLIFMNTEKGRDFLRGVPNLALHEIEEKFVQYVFKEIESPKERLDCQREFFNRANVIGFEKAASEVAKTSWPGRIMIHIRKLIKSTHKLGRVKNFL